MKKNFGQVFKKIILAKAGIFFIYFLAIVFYGFRAHEAHAVSISISDVPSSISSDPFNLTVMVDGAQAGTNYVRVDLYKEDTTHYFGETFNGSSWYGGSEGNQYLPITIVDNQIATASVQAKFGSPNLTEYTGPGSYKLRIRRYTGSGNAASTDQTPKDIQINVILPSPTPTPEPTETPEPDPSPTPNPSPSPKPTPRPSLKPKPSASIFEESPEPSSDVLGVTTENIEPSIVPLVKDVKSDQKPFPVGILFLIAGIFFSSAGGFVAYKKYHVH